MSRALSMLAFMAAGALSMGPGASTFEPPIIDQTPRPKTAEELAARAEKRKQNRKRKATLKAKGKGRR